jgi:hypothetical protein
VSNMRDKRLSTGDVFGFVRPSLDAHSRTISNKTRIAVALSNLQPVL